MRKIANQKNRYKQVRNKRYVNEFSERKSLKMLLEDVDSSKIKQREEKFHMMLNIYLFLDYEIPLFLDYEIPST